MDTTTIDHLTPSAPLPAPPRKRRRGLMLVAGGVVAVLVVGGAALLLRDDGSSSPASQPAGTTLATLPTLTPTDAALALYVAWQRDDSVGAHRVSTSGAAKSMLALRLSSPIVMRTRIRAPLSSG